LGRLVIDIREAFKEAGGASSKYGSELLFLQGFQTTLKRLEEYTRNATGGDAMGSDRLYTQDIADLLPLIAKPLEEFKTFLSKYRKSLAKGSTASKFKKAVRTISFTLKDLGGKVDDLRVQIEQPLQAINAVLSLENM
jgi:hypothetical protein